MRCGRTTRLRYGFAAELLTLREVLDVRRLIALREVADRGTIAAAADALHLTPSAVSQQLAALGREVGRPVVERDGRRVRLTDTAEVLLRHADALLSQVERLHADLDARGAGAVGDVRISGFATSLSGLVAPAAHQLREVAPGVRLRIREAEAPEALRDLGARETDVVLTMESQGAPRRDDPRWLRVDLLRDVLDVALPVDHPLAAPGDAVALGELVEEPWVMPPVGWTCEEVILGGCRTAGFSPQIGHRTADWHVSLALVAAGLGVVLVPRLAALVPPPGVRVVPVAGAAPCRHVFAVCRRGAEDAPAVRATLDALQAVAAGPSRDV